MRRVGELKFGPARVPSRESPEQAVELLLERGYSACEIDFEGKFWMDYPWAEQLGELAAEHGIALSVHAPIAGFMGHAERGKKLNMAIGMLDHSAGIAKASGAELVVFHPGFLLGRTREEALDSVCEQLGELRARLEKKERAVPFGVEVMGRVRELVRRLAGDGLLTTVTTVGGAVYAATTLVGFSLDEAIYTMSDDTYKHTVYPGLIHAANDSGYLIHSVGGAGLGAAIVAVSLAALGARAIPTWLAWVSLVAGLVVIFSFFFFPWFVIAIWLVVASVLVTRALARPAPVT